MENTITKALFRKAFNNIEFVDVVEFCKQRHPEGIQLDYKKDLSEKGLAKHIAAFSNTRGGLIIVGVEENKKTGVPEKYEGIDNDGKLLERISQFASNVQPVPTFEMRLTEEKDGKVFILIRVDEGSVPPYYQINDSVLWIRTGNISNPVDIASPDYVELLINKKENAGKARLNDARLADSIYLNAVTVAETERLVLLKTKPAGEVCKTSVGLNASMLTLELSPFYPSALVDIYDLRPKLQACSTRENFPSYNTTPIPQGLHFFECYQRTGHIRDEQFYSDGFAIVRNDVLSVTDEGARQLKLWQVAAWLYYFLKFAQCFYPALGYEGVLVGALKIDDIGDCWVEKMAVRGGWSHDDPTITPVTQVEIKLNLDTTILRDAELLKQIFIDKLIELHWAVGLEYRSDPRPIFEKIMEESSWKF